MEYKERTQMKIIANEFVLPFTEGWQSHASHFLVLGEGKIFCVYFYGSKEGNGDIRIYGSFRTSDCKWSTPIPLSEDDGIPHWNPVLFRRKDGAVVLYYKVGKTIADWITKCRISYDDCVTWSAPFEMIPGDRSGGRGPVRNKAIYLSDGSILAPGSTERGEWKCFFDRSTDEGKTWERSPDLCIPAQRLAVYESAAEKGIIQPTVWESPTGIHATACTLLPVDADGIPLCCKSEWEHEKHAYVKLWKHHAAQGQADRINALAHNRGEEWIGACGGKLSSEFALPKILQTLEEAPEVYFAAARFTEAGDWLSRVLTGVETHSAVFAGYKASWNAGSGYPSNEFFCALDRRMDGIVGSKLSETVLGVDRIAGQLDAHGAELTGLPEGTPLALPMIDAHAAMPALGITGERELMLIVGTSA